MSQKGKEMQQRALNEIVDVLKAKLPDLEALAQGKTKDLCSECSRRAP